MLDFLAKASTKLISQSAADVTRGAQIRAFWLALANEASAPMVSIPAAQWLVHAALQSHTAAAQAAVQAPPGMSTESGLADRLASLNLSMHDEGVQAKITACEETDEGSIGPLEAPPAYATAAVTAVAALSGAPDPAQRMTASQCALMLLKPGRGRFPQHNMEHEVTSAAAAEALEWEPHSTQAEPMSDSLPADTAPVLEDSALVQLGHTAVRGLGDVSAAVAASWRRVLDAVAPDITRIAGNASRTSLAAFLLLHEVRRHYLMVNCACEVVFRQRRMADRLSSLHDTLRIWIFPCAVCHPDNFSSSVMHV